MWSLDHRLNCTWNKLQLHLDMIQSLVQLLLLYIWFKMLSNWGYSEKLTKTICDVGHTVITFVKNCLLIAQHFLTFEQIKYSKVIRFKSESKLSNFCRSCWITMWSVSESWLCSSNSLKLFLPDRWLMHEPYLFVFKWLWFCDLYPFC